MVPLQELFDTFHFVAELRVSFQHCGPVSTGSKEIRKIAKETCDGCNCQNDGQFEMTIAGGNTAGEEHCLAFKETSQCYRKVAIVLDQVSYIHLRVLSEIVHKPISQITDVSVEHTCTIKLLELYRWQLMWTKGGWQFHGGRDATLSSPWKRIERQIAAL